MLRPLALLLLVCVCCCGSTQQQSADARVRSALDLLAVVVDPAYQIAMQHCTSREMLLADQAETGRLQLAEAERQLAAIRLTCARRRRAFDVIRQGHELAAQQVEAGAVLDAERTLDQVRVAWHDVATSGDP
jgi:hypothetical protein